MIGGESAGTIFTVRSTHRIVGTMSTPVILYILECTHVQPGRVGVIQMECLNCPGAPVRDITDVHLYEWRMYCETCNYKPWCGLSQPLAKHHANGHVRKHPEHKVKVLYMINPFSEKIRDRIQEGLFNASTPRNRKTP